MKYVNVPYMFSNDSVYIYLPVFLMCINKNFYIFRKIETFQWLDQGVRDPTQLNELGYLSHFHFNFFLIIKVAYSHCRHTENYSSLKHPLCYHPLMIAVEYFSILVFGTHLYF